MTLYKNISNAALTVHGFLVKAGETIEHELIENANFKAVKVANATSSDEVSPTTDDSATIKVETKEKK